MKPIYFDQAASSYPKPNGVTEAMIEAVKDYGANPGRGGHTLAKKAEEVIYTTRVKLAKMFGEKKPNNVIFYQNATYALNQAIQGLVLNPGDHIITTTFEHNSVRRPLEYMKREKGLELSYVKVNEDGIVDVGDIHRAIKENTKAIVISHGSNVTGAITPIYEIGEFKKEKNFIFVVDASQTAGVLPIDMGEMNIDCLAFAGHKSMLGPQGTGVLIIKENIQLNPITLGGTGGFSELIEQPDKRPERYESGTLNTPGIAGLLAGIHEIEKLGLDHIYQHEWELTKYFIEELSKMEGVKWYGPSIMTERLPVVPFTIEALDSHEAATILDSHYNIALRAGIHCSPLAHEGLGTIGNGTLRASFGLYNTKEEIDQLIAAIDEIKSYF